MVKHEEAKVLVPPMHSLFIRQEQVTEAWFNVYDYDGVMAYGMPHHKKYYALLMLNDHRITGKLLYRIHVKPKTNANTIA